MCKGKDKTLKARKARALRALTDTAGNKRISIEKAKTALTKAGISDPEQMIRKLIQTHNIKELPNQILDLN